MAHTMIVFAGKGGSGKTTLAAMTLRQLIRAGVGPILAVDADPNATLGMTLGVETAGTIADLRDRMGEKVLPKCAEWCPAAAECFGEATDIRALKARAAQVKDDPRAKQCLQTIRELIQRRNTP
jgi:CO dehydrogenase nickel-insertion accessory protein CooC1